MMKMNFINISKLEELKNVVIDKFNSRHFTGFASIDRPWEKMKFLVPKQIEIPDISYIELIFNRTKFNSCDNVLQCHEASITMQNFKEEVYRYAKALKQMGVKKGDIVPLCMNEVIEASIFEGALNLIGAVSANIPSNLTSTGLKSYLQKFNAQLLIASDSYYEKSLNAIEEKNNIKCIVVPNGNSFKEIKKLSEETNELISASNKIFEENENVILLDSFLKKADEIENIKFEKMSGSIPAKILFTSGSTGEPKSIVLTNKNIVTELIRLKNQTHMQLGPKGVCLKVVSDIYPYGNIISKYFPIYVGKTVGLTPLLNNKNAYYYMDLYKPPFVQGIPSFYFSLENDDRFKKDGMSYLKYAVSGGEKYETTAKERTNAFFKTVGSSAVILDGAGAGEIVACATTAVGSKYNINSVGKPMVGINVKIIDENTKQELKYGQDGLICYSGDTVMQGYYQDEENTSKNIFVDENNIKWFVTDGIGHIDEKGYLYIIGRKARCFITYDNTGSAYKVYPESVEGILKNSQEIEECAVVYTDSSDRGKEPVAYLKLRPEYVLTEYLKNKIIIFCKNSDLPDCSIPYIINEWQGEFPRINDTKVDYNKIQNISNDIMKDSRS